MKYVFICCFLLVSFELNLFCINSRVFLSTKNVCNKVDELHYKVKAFIKSHENTPYSDKVHNDGCGNKTVGFGKKITKASKHLVKLKSIPIELADSLLELDLRKSLYYVDFYYKGLNNNQRYAVAHLVYCIGIGTVRKDKIVDNGKLIKDRLFKNVYIKGKVNKKRYNNRVFEYELFYR